MVTLLRANYPTTGSAPPEPDPPPAPTGATFSLAINADFDPDSPVLKNGLVLSGAALQTWKGVDWLIRNHRARRYVEQGGSDVDDLADRDHLYQYGRVLATIYGELFVVLRLTGDARCLDELVRLWKIQAGELHIGYRNPDTDARWPTHSYRQWAWDGSSSVYRGTDYHGLDNIATHTPLLQLLYALRLNESETSPAGYDYEAEADALEDYIRDWVKVWQGPEASLGIAKNGSPASGWSDNYLGNLHEYYRDLVGPRADAGAWPIQSRHHTHTHLSATTAHIWLGRAITDFAAADPVGVYGVTELFLTRNVFNLSTPYGTGAVFPRSLHDTGHGETGVDKGGPGNYAAGSAYLTLVFNNLMHVWLEGLIPTFPSVLAAGVVRTWNTWLFSGLNTSQGLHISALQDFALTGASSPTRASDGTPLPFVSSEGQSGTSQAPRSNSNLVSSTICQLQAWDTPDDRMQEHVWDRMGRSSLFRDDSDELGKPRVLSPSIGLLLKQVGAKDWNLTT